MERRKKGLSLTLIVILTIGVLTACGQGTEKNGTKDTEKSIDKTTQDKPAKKAKIVMYNPGNGGYQDDTDNKVVLEEIRKKFKADTNIDLDIEAIDVPWKGLPDKMNVVLNSGEQVDSFTIWVAAMRNFVSNEMILPLDELLERHGKNLKKVLPEDAWKFGDIDGKIYGLPKVRIFKEGGIAIRSDWLQKCGLKAPGNLDELYNVLRVFKEKDPAGNGKTVPILSNWLHMDPYLSNNSISRLYDCKHPFTDSDGVLKPPYFNPNYLKHLEFIRKCFDEGLTTKEYFSMKEKDIENKCGSGVVGVFTFSRQDLLTKYGDYKQATPGFKLEFLNIRDINGKYAGDMQNYASDFIMIPANSKNADVVIQYYDWMISSKENYYLVNYGIKDRNWRWEGSQIEILGEPDLKLTKTKNYDGFYNGGFDQDGLPGYGGNISLGLVKPILGDTIAKQIYETEYKMLTQQIEALEFRRPLTYGFSPKLDGIAQQTLDKRVENLKTAVAKYLSGSANLDEVKKAIDAYGKGPGGPEEIKQMDEQYKSWKKKWTK